MYRLYALLALIFAPFLVHAQEVEDGVIAVVNDDVILRSELDDRVDLALLEIGQQSISPLQRRALELRTLQTLIDEELKRQYGKQRRIGVSPDELTNAIAVIEQNNGLQAGEYETIVGDLKAVSDRKIQTEVLWQKIVQRTVLPQIIITNTEVDHLIREMLSSRQVVERELSQILLEVEPGMSDAPIQQRMKEIAAKINSGEATFAQMARAFSEDGAAAKGGYMGWFAVGELLPELEVAAENLKPGEVSLPIKTNAGWHLLKMERQRATERIQTDPVKEVEAWLVQVTKTGDKEADRANLKTLRTALKTFEMGDDVRTFIDDQVDNLAFSSSRSLGWVPLDKLPEALQVPAERTKPSNTTRVVETDDAWQVLYVLNNRTRLPKDLETFRKRFKDRLTATRLDLAARRFLRKLREEAFIDVRL